MKKITAILLTLSFCLTAFAQENALLWEISKRGYKTSYLFGSIHLSDENIIDFGDKVLPYLYKCDAYAGEIIIDPNDMFVMLPYLIEKDSSKQCGKVLSEEELKEVKLVISEKLGEEMNLLVPFMSPYIVASLLASPNEAQEGSSALFLDMYLQEKADSLGKKLISLESVKSQMAYIQKIDGEEQKLHLLSMLEQKDSLDHEIDDLMAIYLAQDLTKIKALLLTAADEDPLFTDGFMEDRNSLQAEGIMASMKSKRVFTAIGAAHLPGEDGVIQLLRNAGFKLEPIPIN